MTSHALRRTSRNLAVGVMLATAVGLAGPTAVQVVAPATAEAAAKSQKTIIDADFDGTKRGSVDPKSFRREVGPTNKNRGTYGGMKYRKDYRVPATWCGRRWPRGKPSSPRVRAAATSS